MRKSILTVAFALSFILIATSPGYSENDRPFTIGCILYLTGDLAMQENAFREGIELARDEINHDGGLNGQAIRVIIEDTKNDPKLGVSATRKFLAIDKVNAALISSYQDAMASGPLYETAKTPAITLWDATPEIDAVGDYVFSLGPWIPSAGEAAADFIFSTLKINLVTTVNTEEQWSQSVADYFKKRFLRLGGTIAAAVSVPADTADFGTVISKIRGSNAKTLYAPLTYNILPFHKRLRSLGWSGPVVSSDIITEELIAQDPTIFEGVYQTGIADPSTAEYQGLAELYRTRFKKEITLPWFVATGYDAVKLVVLAAKDTQGDAVALKNNLYKIHDYRGTARKYSINAGGSAPDMEMMYQIRAGKLVRVPIPSSN